MFQLTRTYIGNVVKDGKIFKQQQEVIDHCFNQFLLNKMWEAEERVDVF